MQQRLRARSRAYSAEIPLVRSLAVKQTNKTNKETSKQQSSSSVGAVLQYKQTISSLVVRMRGGAGGAGGVGVTPIPPTRTNVPKTPQMEKQHTGLRGDGVARGVTRIIVCDLVLGSAAAYD